MLLARHGRGPALLAGLRPLMGWGWPGSAAALHSDSDSDGEVSASALHPRAAALFAELARNAELLRSGGVEEEVQRGVRELLGEEEEERAGEVPPERRRLLQAGVVGAPNAGKSTLVNALTRYKVSAVSPKTNTTQQARLGAFTAGEAQVVLYDTPGVVGQEHYKNPAHQRRVRGAWGVAADCDLLLLLVDAARELARPDPRVRRLLAASGGAAGSGAPEGWRPPPALLVLNKCDAVPPRRRPHLLPLADELRALRPFDDVFFISAKDGRGVDELRECLADRATPGEWTLEAGMATDRGEEEQAMEAVREQLFLRLYQELPYRLSLRMSSCLPQPDGSLGMRIEVLAQQESQRRIVAGIAADVARGAQRQLEAAWGVGVSLEVAAKVDRPR